MQIREFIPFKPKGVLWSWLMAVLWVYVSGSPVFAQEKPVVDETAPLIVSDDPVPEAIPSSPAVTPLDPVPIPLGTGPLQRPVPGGAALLDPTRPVEEVRPAEISKDEPPGSPLLPMGANGTILRPPLSPPEPPPSARGPITATTPFPPDAPRGPGPVMLGTDLEPGAAVTPLSPEQIPPEFVDPPVVVSPDPWVFGVEVASLYDDNIRLSNTDAQQDFLFVLSASVAWQRGDVERRRGSWARVFYEATGILFAEDSSENSVDHDLQAGGQVRWGRLAAALEGRYRRLSGATPDLGDRVERDDSNVKLSGTYDLTGRTFVEANASLNSVRYRDAALADYGEWVVEGLAGYELSGRTKVAVGGAAGRLKVDGNGTQDFQRALVKVTRASTGALGFTGKAGAEFRQTPQGDTITPVFAVAADWEPIEDSTKITAEAFRETVSSGALAGENYVRTGGALRLTQRLGSRIAAGLEAGYEQLAYTEAAAGTASGRDDDYFFAKPSLRYEFDARRRAEIFYNFRQDESSLEGFSFTANQWGLSIGLDF